MMMMGFFVFMTFMIFIVFPKSDKIREISFSDLYKILAEVPGVARGIKKSNIKKID